MVRTARARLWPLLVVAASLAVELALHPGTIPSSHAQVSPTPTPGATLGDDTRGLNPGFSNVGALAGTGPPRAALAELAPLSASDVRGEAILLWTGDLTLLMVSLSGLEPDATYMGHVHDGSCGGRVLFALESIHADAAGRGQATATVGAPIDAATWWVQYHRGSTPPAPAVACGPVVPR